MDKQTLINKVNYLCNNVLPKVQEAGEEVLRSTPAYLSLQPQSPSDYYGQTTLKSPEAQFVLNEVWQQSEYFSNDEEYTLTQTADMLADIFQIRSDLYFYYGKDEDFIRSEHSSLQIASLENMKSDVETAFKDATHNLCLLQVAAADIDKQSPAQDQRLFAQLSQEIQNWTETASDSWAIAAEPPKFLPVDTIAGKAISKLCDKYQTLMNSQEFAPNIQTQQLIRQINAAHELCELATQQLGDSAVELSEADQIYIEALKDVLDAPSQIEKEPIAKSKENALIL